jgi:hypothetical protein
MDDTIDLIGDCHLYAQDACRSVDSPELRLLAAILDDVRYCIAPGSMVDRSTRRDAIAWVRGEVASPSPCSFREICAVLSLDEAAARSRLLALASGETPERRRHLDSLLRAVKTAAHAGDLGARRAASDAAKHWHVVRRLDLAAHAQVARGAAGRDFTGP